MIDKRKIRIFGWTFLLILIIMAIIGFIYMAGGWNLFWQCTVQGGYCK